MMERQTVSSLWQFNENRIFSAFRSVVLGEFGTQTPCLHTNQGVQMRIKTGGAPEDLGRNLIFLQRNSRMLQRLVSQIAQQLTKRLRTMQGMAIHQPLDLGEELLRIRYMARNAHLTESNKPVS